MGTSVSTRVYVVHGWRAAAAISLGCMGFQILALLARGPHCRRYRWFGYEGGIGWRKARDNSVMVEEAMAMSVLTLHSAVDPATL